MGRVAPLSPLLKEIGKRPSLFLKFFSPDPPHEEGSERIYSLPWQPVLETSHIRVVKRALVNNRNQENEIKNVSSTPHSLIVTEIPELRPVLRVANGYLDRLPTYKTMQPCQAATKDVPLSSIP